MMTGGIDLSTGPLAGFLVVIASFYMNDDFSLTAVVMGLVTMALVAVIVGLVNSSLIRFVKFTCNRRNLDNVHCHRWFRLHFAPRAGEASSVRQSLSR